MLPIIKIELFKIFKRGRTYIAFAITGILVFLIMGGMWYEGQKLLDMMLQNLSDTFLLEGNLLNSYFVSYMILSMLFIHIPILIALVTGDLLAGEATSGTFRLLVTRPVSRTRMLTAKFIAGLIYSSAVVIFLGVLCLTLGKLMLGNGDLIVLKMPIYIFSENDVVWRFLYAYLFGMLSMAVVAALSFFFSSLVNNAIGPIISTIGVIIVFTLITSIDLNIFKSIRPFLFTTYIDTWTEFFEDVIDKPKIIKGSVILAGHVLLFYVLTVWHFNRKDILT